jgi:hypothetical protein
LVLVGILIAVALIAPPATSAHGNASVTAGAVTCGRAGAEVSIVVEHPYIFSDTNYAWYAWGVSGYYEGWAGWVQTGPPYPYWKWSPTDGSNSLWNYDTQTYTQFSAVTFIASSALPDLWYVYNHILWEDGHVTGFWSDGAYC